MPSGTKNSSKNAASSSTSKTTAQFGATSITTGFTLPLSTSTISATGTLTVTPAAQASNVTLVVTGTNRVNVKVTNTNTTTGVITFTAMGTSATPNTIPTGDTTIEAQLTGQSLAQMQAIVVVPKSIGTPHPQANQNVAPANLALNASTTPVMLGVPAGQVALITAWFVPLTVTVFDQFNHPLTSIYAGVPVMESTASSGGFQNINSPLTANGTYIDQVGNFFAGPNNIVPVGSPAAIAWPTQPKAAMGPSTVSTPIDVQVGGQAIGTITRTVTTTPPSNVTITWP